MLKVKKFQKFMKEIKFISADSFRRKLKDKASFILIGFKFPELEGKNCELNIGSNDKRLNVLVLRN